MQDLTTTVPAAVQRPSLAGARAFVALVYIFLAGGFLASPWLLYSEFKAHEPLMLAIAHSHLFIFFPTFGLLALAAFYLPSVIFTHLYWHHLPYGRLRFLLGFAVAVGLAVWASVAWLGETAKLRAIWEVAPRALEADRGEPQGCVGNNCIRGSILPVLKKLRAAAQETTSLSKFGRACKADAYLELPEEHNKLRWCFPAQRHLNTSDCCQSQLAFTRAVNGHYRTPGNRSHLASMDTLLQPLKSFFIVVVLVIGGMLVVWQNQVRTYYPKLHFRMERHIFVGALAMLLWPIMDYAYLDTTNALFGRPSPELQPRLSLVVVPWALLLLFYYLQRFARRVEVIGQIVTVAGTLLAVIARDELKDWAVRLVGIGMPVWMGAVLAVAWLAGMIAVFAPERLMPKPPEPRP